MTARLPKVKLRAIPVFPSTVTGGSGIAVVKANGTYSIEWDVSAFQIARVADADVATTYAASWGRVTDDNPDGVFQLVPFSSFQNHSNDLTSLSEAGTFGIVSRISTADYSTRTITGTSNRVTVTNGSGVSGNPTLDISTSYVGQNTITTLGTVGTGVWQATTVAVGFGGTGLTSYATGDTLYASSASVLGKLSGNTTATRKFLRQTGTGSASQAPAWDTLLAADVPTLNQNTTGSAATLTTPRAIDGQNFDGSAAITVVAPGTHAATSKATPVDADELPLVDSAASNVLKKLTWANLKATLKSAVIGVEDLTGTAWTAWTPTLTAGTGTFTSAVAAGRYKTIGPKTLAFQIQVTITTNGTAAVFIKVTMPPGLTENASLSQSINGREAINGFSVNAFPLSGEIYIKKYDGTYPGATGNIVTVGGTIELA